MYCQHSLSNAVRKLTTRRQAGDQKTSARHGVCHALTVILAMNSTKFLGTNCDLHFLNNFAKYYNLQLLCLLRKLILRTLRPTEQYVCYRSFAQLIRSLLWVAYISNCDNVDHSRVEAVNEIKIFFSAGNLDTIPNACVNHPFWISALTSLYSHFLQCHVERMVLDPFYCWHNVIWLIGLAIVITYK